jgi:hypothetical protein
MKRSLIPVVVSLIFLSFATFTACEDDPLILYPEVDPFDKLVVAQNVTVKLMNGAPDLSVSGSGDLSSVQLVVSDGILSIALPNPGTAQNVVVEIYHNDMVSVSCTQNGRLNLASDFSTSSPTLTVSAYNASAIYSYHTISVDTLDIRLSDAAFVGFSQVEVSKNKLTMWSGTLCFLEGTADDQLIEMTDGCYYNLDDRDSGWAFSGPLQAASTWVTARNAAMAWVHASTYLNAVGTTGSMVYYKGNPSTIEENMTTGAELIQKNE